jgi:hypothetical protein
LKLDLGVCVLRRLGILKKEKPLTKVKTKVVTCFKKRGAYRKNTSVLQEVGTTDFCCNKRDFDIVCIVHLNQLYKQTNEMHFLHVFIVQFLYNSTCFERPFCSWTSDDEGNGRSKHVELYKNCTINTYRKCIVFVCLFVCLFI